MPIVQESYNAGIATVSFETAQHNALPLEGLQSLAASLRSVSQNPETRVIVLQSGGDKTFCAGASFDELIALQDIASAKRFFMGFADVILAIRQSPVMVIARVQGKAVGGGVGLIAACDYAVATTACTIRLSELSIGIGPFVIGPAVERKTGLAAFSQMSINASEWKTAQWAKEKGLFADVLTDIPQVDAYIQHLATQLASYEPAATRAVRNMLWQGTEHWPALLAERAETSAKLVLQPEVTAKLQAFKAKNA